MPGLDKNKLELFRRGEVKFMHVFNMDAKQMASLLVTGHNFFSQGRIEEARLIFEGLSLLDPRNAYVNCILGAIYQQMGKYDQSVFRYTLALEIFPKDIQALTNRGEIYLKVGKFRDAAHDLKAAIDLDPGKAHPAANRARLLASMAVEALSSKHR